MRMYSRLPVSRRPDWGSADYGDYNQPTLGGKQSNSLSNRLSDETSAVLLLEMQISPERNSQP